MISLAYTRNRLEIVCRWPEPVSVPHTIFVAINSDPAEGSAIVPFGQRAEGSTVFLPFRADRLYSVATSPSGSATKMRFWKQTVWGAIDDVSEDVPVEGSAAETRISIAVTRGGSGQPLRVAVYVKEMSANDGWGCMLANRELGVSEGCDDKAVERFHEIDQATGALSSRGRFQGERARIYQLFPRLFGNTNETRKPNGTLAENGVGKFADINDAALEAIRRMGFTHVWLTGVLQQMSATDYSSFGEPAEDPDLLKGLAGSPYAIKDYFDVSPDYAVRPAERLQEFRALLDRVHAHGMKAIIDFVPNHVARSYYSNIHPDLSFGNCDDRTKFFDPANNFFYLNGNDPGQGPPVVLPTMSEGKAVTPTCLVLGTCDGKYNGELDYGRVTGNNVVSWRPGVTDWYETVKLNYGYDFTTGARAYPHGECGGAKCPNTWEKMDCILAYWQEMGVDGFRCDMAHMVPPEFWSWAIGRARARKADVWFTAEAYDNDPAKVRSGNPVSLALNWGRGNVMYDLLGAGFDAVYDDPSYKCLKGIYDGGGWANDLDGSFPHPYIFHNSLRYAENHDEVRLASREWGGVGPLVGRSVSAILFALGRGPVMVYNGQEVGEPAQGVAGFAGDNSRTTIFDYWSMPEFTKWVNGHRYDGGALSPEQKALREFYSRLINLVGEPAFREGEFFPLNGVNNQNEQAGRVWGDSASGHWLYSFVRSSGPDGQHFLVVANLHRTETLRDVRLRFSVEALHFMGADPQRKIQLTERLQTEPRVLTSEPAGPGERSVLIPEIPPLTPFYFELKI